MEQLIRTEEELFKGLINRSVFTWMIFGTIGMIMVIYRSDITGWGMRENGQALLWFGTMLLGVYRNRIKVKFKAGILTAILSVFSLMGVLTLGFLAAAIHFIPLTGILLILFFPSKLVQKYYLMALLLMTITAFLFVLRWVELPVDAGVLITSWQHWLLVLFCFIFYIYFSTTALLLYKNETNSLLVQLQAKNNRLKEASFVDAMTGLPRLTKGDQLFSDNLSLWKENNEQVAVMYLDLDEFKVINEVYGHEAGDWCIKETARKLEKFVEGQGFVMRIGSDEFLLVYSGFDLKMHAISWATKMLAELQVPIALEKVNLKLSSSVGIAFYPEDGESLSTLRRKADLAMYRAKVDENLSISTYKSATT